MPLSDIVVLLVIIAGTTASAVLLRRRGIRGGGRRELPEIPRATPTGGLEDATGRAPGVPWQPLSKESLR